MVVDVLGDAVEQAPRRTAAGRQLRATAATVVKGANRTHCLLVDHRSLAGLPGGGGIKLAYSNPLLMDAVAADHPALQVVLAHPSVPWQDEANSMARHKTNVWIDLSGWSPKYFPESLVALAGGALQDRVLFGTDFPLITPEKWLGAFDALPIDRVIHPKILETNAARLLGLS